MKVVDIASLLNKVMDSLLGRDATADNYTALVNEDLSNLADVGTNICEDNVENYLKKMIDQIGLIIYSTRAYNGRYPNLFKDQWTFGSIIAKYTPKLLKADENESWKLEKGRTYDMTEFTPPEISTEIFNKTQTYDIPISIAERQAYSSFKTPEEMNRFISMIETTIQNTREFMRDTYASRAINNMIALTVLKEYSNGNMDSKSGVRVINLLYLYNQAKGGTALTKQQALLNQDFLKFASMVIKATSDAIVPFEVKYNLKGIQRHTPKDRQHLYLNSLFSSYLDSYLNSDETYSSLAKLDNFERVPYWQASGKTPTDFDSVTGINVIATSGATLNMTGIVGILFDTDAVALYNENNRVKRFPVEVAEFINYWYKSDVQIVNSLTENFVVFVMQ